MLKEVFDYSMALLGLIIFMPIMLILALLIRVRMPGAPVLFRQKRVGRHGSLFTLVKFRTMTPVHSGSSVSVAGESRITPLGATLRKYKLDELPELWNVLRGDMSFVGPRPDVPGYADKLSGADRAILELKPGITGPATLKYRNEEELLASQPDPCRYNDEVIFPDKVKINLSYLSNRSFMGDIRIIMRTLIPSSI
ncbi:MAG: sugar transferase [Muribaculaceae bacterium]|nr:sugar transferase [Muribaculaceae bacterium]